MKAVRDGIETRYIYDGAGNLLAEADENNNITNYYIYGAGLMAMVNASDNQVYTYHFNQVGSTVAMTDNSKNIVNKYAYDEFGNILAQEETVAQPFKFVGQFGVMTEPNGFYYMKARYYDPKVGRFISEDPIGFEGGDVNLMAYVGNNPVNGIDPSGRAAFWYHFYDGFVYGLSQGKGLWDCLRYGAINLMFDFDKNYMNDSMLHATSERGGTPAAAVVASYLSAQISLLSNKEDVQLQGVHTMRDIRSHQGALFEGFGNAISVIKHWIKYDLLPGDDLENVVSGAMSSLGLQGSSPGYSGGK